MMPRLVPQKGLKGMGIPWALLLIMGLAVLAILVLCWYMPTLRALENVQAELLAETQLVEGMAQNVARLPPIKARLKELQGELEGLVRVMPRAGDLPVVIKELQHMANFFGLAGFQAELRPVHWEDNRGEAELLLSFQGDWGAGLSFLSALPGALPTHEIGHLKVLVDETKLKWQLALGLAVLPDPYGGPAWIPRDGSKMVITQHSPFAAAKGPSPQAIQLRGIASSPDGCWAVVAIGGESRPVRVGDVVGGLSVTKITGEGVVLNLGGTEVILRMEGL
ncbi:MAG: hypothetical protein GX980_01205 [Firmicutes bacterium]|nr:hypothetical protein [Bacillota bacterium]